MVKLKKNLSKLLFLLSIGSALGLLIATSTPSLTEEQKTNLKKLDSTYKIKYDSLNKWYLDKKEEIGIGKYTPSL